MSLFVHRKSMEPSSSSCTEGLCQINTWKRCKTALLVVIIIMLISACNSQPHGWYSSNNRYREHKNTVKPIAKGKDKVLYIGGIFPMTGGWAGGKGCRPAVDMALEDVNSNENILPGYRLEMFANDSMVSAVLCFVFVF